MNGFLGRDELPLIRFRPRQVFSAPDELPLIPGGKLFFQRSSPIRENNASDRLEQNSFFRRKLSQVPHENPARLFQRRRLRETFDPVIQLLPAIGYLFEQDDQIRG